MRSATSRCAAVIAVVLVAGCGIRGRGVDAGRLVKELGLDGAAQALRVRIAGNARDVEARRALAIVEDQRGRPGAVIEQMAAMEALQGLVGNGLSDREERRYAELLRARAKERVARGSPDAIADLDHARRLVGGDDAELRRGAEVNAAVAALRSTDPDRRAAGARALAKAAPDLAAVGAPEKADVDALGRTGLFLWERGAKRAGYELLEAWERGGGRDAGAADTAARVDAWLAARAWWHGPHGRPDLSTLSRAVAAGGDACRFAATEGELGCAVHDAVGIEAERRRIAQARDRGWRTSDPAEAAAWVGVLARAWRRGEIRSWLDELDARVDLAALGIATSGASRLSADVPTWARPTLLRAAGRADEAATALRRVKDGELTPEQAEVIAAERMIAAGETPETATVAAGDVDRASVIAAAVARTDDEAALLAPVARAFLRDAAAGDRTAEDAAARDVDVAAVAPAIAELFLALGDPARARGWYQRAVDACPGEVAPRAGLARAMAAAGDPAAARQQLVIVAADSGDAAATLVDGARALRDAGELVDALVPAKQAMEQLPPGTEAELLALLVDIAGALDRADQRADFAAALAAVRPPRDATTLRARAAAGDTTAVTSATAADPADVALAVAAAALDADDATALARLDRAARWNPHDVAVRAAILARDPTRTATTAELAAIAADRSLPAATRRAAAQVGPTR